jgi:hypothetical protein
MPRATVLSRDRRERSASGFDSLRSTAPFGRGSESGSERRLLYAQIRRSGWNFGHHFHVVHTIRISRVPPLV